MKYKIIGQEYDVIETGIETLRKEAELENDNGFFYGATHFPTARIFLNQALTEHTMKATLRHELCHAFLFEAGHTLECVTEETICNVMGAFGEEICKIANDYFIKRAETIKESKFTTTTHLNSEPCTVRPYNSYEDAYKPAVFMGAEKPYDYDIAHKVTANVKEN